MSFEKWKKSRISHWSESDENAKWLRDCLWLCQACKRGFTCSPVERNLRQEAHSYPQADICSAPLQLPAWHTSNNRLWSPQGLRPSGAIIVCGAPTAYGVAGQWQNILWKESTKKFFSQCFHCLWNQKKKQEKNWWKQKKITREL